MPRFLGPLFALVAASCASASSDYTPPIHVVPGAAARSLWIASKRPPPDDDAGDPAEDPPPDAPEDASAE